jgi:hypothetical protein
VLIRKTLGQFDADTGGVGEKGGGKLKLRKHLVGRVEFDSVVNEFLAEALEVFDLEYDVIDSSSGGALQNRHAQRKSGARDEIGIRLILPSRSRAEDLCIPGLYLLWPGCEVNLIKLQRRVYRTVFGQFDAHGVGPVDDESVARWLKALIASFR